MENLLLKILKALQRGEKIKVKKKTQRSNRRWMEN